MKIDTITAEEARRIYQAVNNRAVEMREIGEPRSITHDANRRNLSPLQPIFERFGQSAENFAFVLEINLKGDHDFLRRIYQRLGFRMDTGVGVNNTGINIPILPICAERDLEFRVVDLQEAIDVMHDNYAFSLLQSSGILNNTRFGIIKNTN